MGIIQGINKLLTSQTFKEVRAFGADTSVDPETMPFLPNWFWTAHLGTPRNINVTELRAYAKSCWVQMVENAVLKQSTSIEWDVINTDEEDKQTYDIDKDKVTTLLKYPNQNGDTFWNVWGPWLIDVIEVDAGVIFKGRNTFGELVQLFSYDGSRFLIKLQENALIDGYYQYSYKYPAALPRFFEKQDIVYGQMKRTNETFPYGWSPMQSIQQEVEIMIQSNRYNREFFKNNAVPNAIVTVPMEQSQMRRYRAEWQQKNKGKPHRLMFHNSPGVDVKILSQNNRDMEWLDGQQWYFHQVFGIFGFSPEEVGFYEKSGRATGESQERITLKNAIKPYLQLIEQKINREIIPELVGHDRIKFNFNVTDDVAEKVMHQQKMEKLDRNVYTINEVRLMEGKEAVEWGEQPMSLVMQDRFADRMEKQEGTPPGNIPDKNKKDDEKEERDKKDTRKEPGEKSIKEPRPDPILASDAKEYDEFLKTVFAHWEKEILKYAEKTLKEELPTTDKSFSQFMSTLFNVVNTSGFYDKISKIIKLKIMSGHEEAEKELDINIEFEPSKETLDQLTRRQLDGFVLEDGNRWAGIKGVAKDVQDEISSIVRDSIADRDSMTELRDKIGDKMIQYKGGTRVTGEVTEGRAMRIARTETNRFENSGKVESYKKSGLKGMKKWVAAQPRGCPGCSPICDALDGAKVPLDEPFTVFYKAKKGTGTWEGFHPPAHPHCKSTVQFVPE